MYINEWFMHGFQDVLNPRWISFMRTLFKEVFFNFDKFPEILTFKFYCLRAFKSQNKSLICCTCTTKYQVSYKPQPPSKLMPREWAKCPPSCKKMQILTIQLHADQLRELFYLPTPIRHSKCRLCLVYLWY